ncbi:MAG: hypothetical protein ABIL77_01670 [candidate division WOR-3 bacterium]
MTLSAPVKGRIVISGVDVSVNNKGIKTLIALVPQEKIFDRELTVDSMIGLGPKIK